MARRVRSVGLIRRLRARLGAQLRWCGGLVAALRLVEWFGGWLGDVFGLGLLAVFGGAAVRCRVAARSGSGEGGGRADARERVSSAWSLRSRIASSTTVCSRYSASTRSSSSVRFEANAKYCQLGNSSACLSTRRVRGTISRQPPCLVSAI